MNLGYIAIQNIHCADYRCVISGISKSEAINLMQNIDLTEKSGTLEKIIFFSHLKMDEEILTFGDIENEKQLNFTTILLLKKAIKIYSLLV